MSNHHFVLLVLLAPFTAPLHAADTRIGAGCDLETIGVKDKADFRQFDHDLRFGLGQANAETMAMLTQFPLRVNFADGSHVAIADAQTLQKQFDRIFPLAARKAVQAESLDDLFCRAADGIGYDDGFLWVKPAGDGDRQLRIVAVNVPGPAPAASAPGAIELACSTKAVRFVIDTTGDSKARYRAWNLPHATSAKPDIELTGTSTSEGSSPCVHRTWQFKNKNATYLIGEPGCNPETPENGLAELRVLIDGKDRLHAWCF